MASYEEVKVEEEVVEEIIEVRPPRRQRIMEWLSKAQFAATTVLVVSLLAVLELCRQGKIRTQQTELFGDIIIEARAPEPEAQSAEAAAITATTSTTPTTATESWGPETTNPTSASAGGV